MSRKDTLEEIVGIQAIFWMHWAAVSVGTIMLIHKLIFGDNDES